MSSQDLRAHRDKMYNGETSFVSNLSWKCGCFEPAGCEWAAGLLSLLSAKLHGLKFDKRISCMQIKLSAERNPLDLTCFKVSSCWLCLLSGFFSVSSSSWGCFTDPHPCVRLLLFHKCYIGFYHKITWENSYLSVLVNRLLSFLLSAELPLWLSFLLFPAHVSSSVFSLCRLICLSACQSPCEGAKAQAHHLSLAPNERKDRFYLWVVDWKRPK